MDSRTPALGQCMSTTHTHTRTHARRLGVCFQANLRYLATAVFPEWWQGRTKGFRGIYTQKLLSKRATVQYITWVCYTCITFLVHIPYGYDRLNYYYNYNRFTALLPGPPGWAGARREVLDFMVQGNISRGRNTDHPAERHSIRTNQCPPPVHHPPFFTGRMPFLPPNQQCQSTEG